jgi:hypothetical protein
MEGSVHVDDGGTDTSSTPTTETPTGEKSQGTVKDVQTSGESGTDSHVESQSEQHLTEKGTKLDSDPLTAAHQELANERKLRGQYETVLKSPELLRRFAQEAGYTLAEAKDALKEEVYSADKLQTGEDVARALNEVRASATSYKTEIDSLKRELSDLKSGRQQEQFVSTLTHDVSEVRGKYPALDPTDPAYDPDLEREIGELYQEVDLDEQTGRFRGKYSLVKIADRVMKAAGIAKKKGSQEAQTDVKVKERGKVTTSSKPAGEASESSDPGTAIAQRIAKALKK